jgi:hypothetical protein
MELVGEEKRIQALFSELRLAEEQAAPSFAGVWNRAQSRPRARVSPLNFSLAAAAFAIFVAVLGLALWSSDRPQTPQPKNTIAAAPVNASVRPRSTTSAAPSGTLDKKEQPRVSRNARAAGFAARQRAELLAARRAEIRDATAISSWQSPTATLLSSQNDALLNSLPQLNESVKELKSFLPNK